MAELFEQSAQVVATLLQVNPPLRAAITRLVSAAPTQPVLEAWIGGDDFSAIARDPLLRNVLEMAPVRDLHLEQFLTLTRRGLLTIACASSATGRPETN